MYDCLWSKCPDMIWVSPSVNGDKLDELDWYMYGLSKLF